MFTEALRLDPYSYTWLGTELGVMQTAAGQYGQAVETFRAAKYLAPWTLCFFAICNVQLGDIPAARHILDEFANSVPGMMASEYFRQFAIYTDKEKLQLFTDALRRAETMS